MPVTTVYGVGPNGQPSSAGMIAKRISIAAQTQLPGDSAAMVVEEWKKFTGHDYGKDFCAILEVMIEQAIIAHRMRYTETQAFQSGYPEHTGWVSRNLSAQAKLLCEISETWLEASDPTSHDLLYDAVTQLLSSVHGLPASETPRELMFIWMETCNLSLLAAHLHAVTLFITHALAAHVTRAQSGDINETINANLAFTRRALVFRLKAPQAQNARDELVKLEGLWDSIVKEV